MIHIGLHGAQARGTAGPLVILPSKLTWVQYGTIAIQ